MFLNLENLIDFNFYGLVEINENILNKFIEFLKENDQITSSKPNAWIDDNFWLDPSKGPEINSQYFTVGNSINFKFWEYKDKGIERVKGIKGNVECKGSSFMWRSLKVCIYSGILIQ